MAEPSVISALGPLTLEIGTQAVDLGGTLPQALLAALVAHHPNAVSVERLTTVLWPDGPPPKYLNALHAYVSRLRGLLRDQAELRSEAAGYRLVLTGATLDVHAFNRLVDEAVQAAAAGRHAQVVTTLTAALASWRSPFPLEPWQDVDWVRNFSRALTHRRRQAMDLLASAYLELDQPVAAAALLTPLVRDDPAAELRVRALMLAQYRSGRQTAALDEFHQLRRLVLTSHGGDPLPPVRELYLQILRHDPELDWKPGNPGLTSVLPMLRPRRLFGRDSLLADLGATFDQDRVAVLIGLAGVGKTAVAAEFAHGFDGLACWVPAEDPAAALNALGELASRLGAPPGLAEVDLMAALWRRLPPDGRWLIVYDNASDADAIRPFLPARPDGQILITSRSVAWSGIGRTMRVEPLDAAAARAFVIRHSGPRAGDPEPLVEVAGGLPLALEQACSYIDGRQGSIARYLELFKDHERDLLAKSAPAMHPHPVTTTLELAFAEIRNASPLAAEILETVAFSSAEGVPLDVIKPGLSEQHPFAVDDAIEVLLRHSVLDRVDSSLRTHRLVQDLVRESLPPDQRLHLVDRLARRLAELLPADGTQPATWAAWLTFTPHVLALMRAAASCPTVPDSLLDLVLPSYRYLQAQGSSAGARMLLENALALRGTGPQQAIRTGQLQSALGEVLDTVGERDAARQQLQEALRSFAASPSPVPPLDWARAWECLAHVEHCTGHHREAVELYGRARPILAGGPDLEEVARATIGLGYAYWGQAHAERRSELFGEAADMFREVCRLAEDAGWFPHPVHVEAVSGLGMMLHEQGDARSAIVHQLEALDELDRIHGETDRDVKAYVLDKLGYAERLLGRYGDSLTHHQAAADMLTRLFGPHDFRVAMMISNLGEAHRAVGDLEQARECQRRALAILGDFDEPNDERRLLVADRLAALDARPSNFGGTHVAGAAR